MNFINNYLSFNKMMGESLVHKLFYALVALSLWGFIQTLLRGIKFMDLSFMGGLKIIFWAFIGLVVALLFFRVLAEVFISHFRTRDRMTELRNHAVGDVWMPEQSAQSPVQAMKEAAEKAKAKAESTAKAAKNKMDDKRDKDD